MTWAKQRKSVHFSIWTSHYEGNTRVHFSHTIFKELKKIFPKSDFSWSCIKMCWMVQSQLFDDEIIARWKTSLKHCWWSFRQEIIPYDKIRSLSAGLYQNFNQFDSFKYCIACWFFAHFTDLKFSKKLIFLKILYSSIWKNVKIVKWKTKRFGVC